MNVLLVGVGYIGSYLLREFRDTELKVAYCDKDAGQLPSLGQSFSKSYQELQDNELRAFDAILWFAGHSTVSKSVQDPEGAVANNCFDLLSFAKRKSPSTKLIYASTGSIYSSEAEIGAAPPFLDETETRLSPLNAYDSSKIAFDALAACFAENVTGLRLGTVCGFSPNLRTDLVFNSMNLSAVRDREVRVANAHSYRTILFLEHLKFYVKQLLLHRGPLPKIVNVGSMSVSIGDIAKEVSDFHSVPIRRLSDSKTYSFRMNCNLVQSICGIPESTTISQQCAKFIADYKNGSQQ